MATATRTATVNDPVGIHARPAAEFAQAATVSGCAVTIEAAAACAGEAGCDWIVL